MSLLDTIAGGLSGETLGTLAQSVGLDTATAGKAIGPGIGSLLTGLEGLSKAPGGLESIAGLLGNADDSILTNIGGFLGGPAAAQGANLLPSILGGQHESTVGKLAKLAGSNPAVAMKLLGFLAPVVLGFVKKAVAGKSPEDIMSFLGTEGSAVRNAAPGLAGWLERIDANDDNNIVDDLGRLASKWFGV